MSSLWVKLPERVLFDPELNSTEKCVYAALVKHVNWGTGACYPSYECLARELGVMERTIGGSLAKLKKRGHVKWTRGGPGRPNRYELLSNCALDEGADGDQGTLEVRKIATHPMDNRQDVAPLIGRILPTELDQELEHVAAVASDSRLGLLRAAEDRWPSCGKRLIVQEVDRAIARLRADELLIAEVAAIVTDRSDLAHPRALRFLCDDALKLGPRPARPGGDLRARTEPEHGIQCPTCRRTDAIRTEVWIECRDCGAIPIERLGRGDRRGTATQPRRGDP